ncbi:hypothetical protein AMS69_18670 [Haloarcula rubripromontorii]|uniref:Uncharacterized protein n=1 Tax=Haloarcula rubripromontorii TaxID=1705562 RepID=A0A0N0BMT5_9EURY|nr:hypothetical protein AMS69_18670 [Haloarcula rubripromontorii]
MKSNHVWRFTTAVEAQVREVIVYSPTFQRFATVISKNFLIPFMTSSPPFTTGGYRIRTAGHLNKRYTNLGATGEHIDMGVSGYLFYY